MRQLGLAVAASIVFALALPRVVLADDIVHTVQPGENLFRIGLKYGVGWQAIMAANGLSSTDIYVGQQLRIPSAGSSSAAPAAAPANAYTVARGDSLGAIAARFGTTASAVAAANNLSDPNKIYYGQVLSIPGGQPPMAAREMAASGSRLILVDISEQRMYVYEGNHLIWSWVASTGERGRDTVPGSYRVLNKIPNAYASTWNLQMPYWLGIYWAGPLQNGIHALPILSNGQQLWAGWLGTPVSYGCVILGVDEARTLYEWAALDTAVTIRW